MHYFCFQPCSCIIFLKLKNILKLSKIKFKINNIIYAIFIAFIFVILLKIIFHNFSFNNFEIRTLSNFNIYYIIKVVLVAAICEEMIFRLLFFNFTKDYFNNFIQITFISLVFAISHLDFLIANLISYFTFSVIISLFYIKTNDIVATCFLHLFTNFTLYVLIIH